jgi:hypothetical protein
MRICKAWKNQRKAAKWAETSMSSWSQVTMSTVTSKQISPSCLLSPLCLFLIPLLAVCSMVFTSVGLFLGLGFRFWLKRLVVVWFQFFFICGICFQFLGLGGGLSFGSFLIYFLVRFRLWFSVPLLRNLQFWVHHPKYKNWQFKKNTIIIFSLQ